MKNKIIICICLFMSSSAVYAQDTTIVDWDTSSIVWEETMDSIFGNLDAGFLETDYLLDRGQFVDPAFYGTVAHDSNKANSFHGRFTKGKNGAENFMVLNFCRKISLYCTK